MPQQGSYGSLGGSDRSPPCVQRSTQFVGDSESSVGYIGSFDRTVGHGGSHVPQGLVSSTGFPWWRVAIIAAAAATALSATVGIAHVATYARVLESPVHSSAPHLAEPSNVEADQQLEEQQRPDMQQPLSFVHEPSSPVSGEKVGDTSQSLVFIAMNEYTRRGDTVGVGYPWLEGKILVEPHRETSLEVVSPVEGMSYYWNIVEKDHPEHSLGDYVGSSVDLMFHTSPEYTVTLVEKAWDGKTTRSSVVNIFCKYVRREIRSLTDGERNEMFDAMKASTPVGHRLCRVACSFF